ncbi:MAG: hypothetical protein IT376_13835, partial [Polyangiaceae bacterium]|nr:hypothetical protein [Polyangiaceae bacterium]
VWRAAPRTGELWLEGAPLAVTVFCPNPQSNGPRLGLWSFGKIPTSGGQRLWGELDEMVIWHRALTPAEIASEHNGGSGVAH